MVSIIVAVDRNNTLGHNNRLPWHLPADLAYFKAVTMDHPIVMGRKTHEAIGRPLPGRENIILTRNTNYYADGCIVVQSVGEILGRFAGEDIFVIGGAEVIQAFLPHTDQLYITRIEENFEGDVFFPRIEPNDWRLLSRHEGVTDEKNPYPYSFLIYERKK